MRTPANRDVFINCPFDADYAAFFHAIVYTVVRAGFRPRCALETDDASENRFEKICKIIAESRYGIHDICRTELDTKSGLPRFNMPLELGIFLAAKRFGRGDQKKKSCIVLDCEKYRYQTFISDISGQDIHAHDRDVDTLIETLATWLRNHSRSRKVPGGRAMAREYEVFTGKLPLYAEAQRLKVSELSYGDFVAIVTEYLTVTSRRRPRA